MENFKDKVFSGSSSLSMEDAQVIFVADLFAEDYEGGAELTTKALIDASPFKVYKLRSSNVTLDTLSKGVDKYWVFGNFAGLNPQLIPSIVSNLKYSILEYDYKYCRYRSPEKHMAIAQVPCDCHNQLNGKLVSAFYFGSQGMWWMSEGQLQKYLTLFPFLAEKSNVVLSSVFDKDTLGLLKALRQGISDSAEQRRGWVVLGSDSWIKGSDAATQWCTQNKKEILKLWNVPYKEALAQLAAAEGFVYLPLGKDTCPRMVIEAKLLGCKLQLNENVQHKNEEWFATDNLEEIEEYLYGAPELFWNGIRNMMEYRPTISGYTTVYNASSQGYPFVQSIKSMLDFCDEVCVVDGGSTDGTWETVLELCQADPRVKSKRVVRDWNHPRFAVFDGMQKAEARAMCTSEFCWQMDCDEVVHESDSKKIIELCRKFPNGVDIISLPVVEYWGGPDKVRADIMPWKWRISRNSPNITHGIPAELRKLDNDGNVYAAAGDGCDMIDKDSGERIPHISFYTSEVDAARRAAVAGNEQALGQYQIWFNNVVESLPGVFHYSWYDIERKIKLYKNYWTKHWESISGKTYVDTAESNMMFNVPWSQVTDQMIKERAAELAQKLGGWIWHSKWDGVQKTHHIVVNKSQPKWMLEETK
jgi:glycosyltransferase involved in cell wall biosynthesis